MPRESGFRKAAGSAPDGLMVFARVAETRNAWAYAIVPDGFLPPWLLQPPSVLLAKQGGYSIWYREVADIIGDMASYGKWDVPGR